MLNSEQRKKLLNMARCAISDYLTTGCASEPKEQDPLFTTNRGAFITITECGDLRGCIGRIVADTPLCKTVCDMAIEAAVGDPRFRPLTKSDLEKIELEISVLSELLKIADIKKIEPGSHGLLIKKGFNTGLLLPQVATEYGWGRIEFLEHTCRKAGLGKDAWREGAEIYIFCAEVFSEKDF